MASRGVQSAGVQKLLEAEEKAALLVKKARAGLEFSWRFGPTFAT